MLTSREQAWPTIRCAREDEMDAVRSLFREYEAWLDVDLCFQEFERELAALPGKYVPPRGGIWVGDAADDLAGVVALRSFAGDIAELKRLWVRPHHRGRGLGRRLALAAIEAARSAGYAAIRLDTLRQMKPARALYRELGFRTIEPYYANPLDGVVYMEIDLSD